MQLTLLGSVSEYPFTRKRELPKTPAVLPVGKPNAAPVTVTELPVHEPPTFGEQDTLPEGVIEPTPLGGVVWGFCSCQLVPFLTTVATWVESKSLAANAPPPTLVIVSAPKPLTFRVGVVVAFAATGKNLTVRPSA